ncbi:PIN domain-containing protein [Peribacillus cavernae]|nr:PIN domain-containing protein [Peribacillus cavernae]MDQ0220707.1 putative nucleic acid-binding protein [Peribacillus cavernae]
MSLILKPETRVMLDTTVLCSSILTDGLNLKLLRAARAGRYQAVISSICLFEFRRYALEGIKQGKNSFQFTDSYFEKFMELVVFPALRGQPVSESLVSRHSYEVVKMADHRTPIGDMLYELTLMTQEQVVFILEDNNMTKPLSEFDLQDAHVWTTAVATECEYIVTSNKRKFPETIGNIERIHPIDFAKLIGI